MRCPHLAIPHPPTEWVTSSLTALERCLHNNPSPHPFHGVVRICMVSVDFYDAHCCKVQAPSKRWMRVRKIVWTQYFGKIGQILGIYIFTTNFTNKFLKSTISHTPQQPTNLRGGVADHFYTDGSKRNCRQQP